MRSSARVVTPHAALLIIALVTVSALMGCGKKDGGDEASAPEGPPGAMSPGGDLAGGPGGPGTPGGMGGPEGPPAGGAAGGPGAGDEMGGPGGMGGAPSGGSAPGGGAPAVAADVAPSAAPSAEDTKFVGEAVTILRTLMTRNVPAPEPEEEEAAKGAEKTGAPGAAPDESASADGDMEFTQAGPPGGPDAGAAGGPQGMGGGEGGPAGGGAAAGAKSMPPMALALTVKNVCQKTRGIKMANQRWFHEYWFFMARSLLDEVATKYSDFPLTQLAHAAQVKSDWEPYLWHWAVREMMAQSKYSDLEEVGAHVAKARVALATIHAICRYGILMEKVDEAKLGKIIWPTVDHVANCIQISFGNPRYDPATIERDETKRSRLMVELFDNYLKWGQNWYWQRSRSWAYLARVSENLPAYKCDACGNKLTQDRHMWRCSRCGKTARPKIPGTVEVVEPHKCVECGYQDEYRSFGLRCPACEKSQDGRYVLNRSWNTPTFARRQQGLKNAQKTHKTLSMVFADTSTLPTKADRDAYNGWLARSPEPERVPKTHQMELEAHEMRLRDAALPAKR